MAIDIGMYSNMRGADIMGGIDKGMRMRDMMDQRKLSQQKLADEQKIKAAYNAGVTVGPDGQPVFDKNATLSALANSGMGQEALAARQQFQQQDLVSQKAQAENKMQELGLIGQIAGSVTDQSSYNQGLQQLQSIGIDVSQLPRQYDPNLVKQYQIRALSASDQIAQQWKEREFRTDAKTPNLGQAPKGYRFRPDGSLEAIPGGPAEIQQKEFLEKKEKMKEVVGAQATLVTEEISRALDLVKNNELAAGPYAGKTAFIPGTPAQRLRDLIQSIKSNVAFDKLQAMREASPTGGALGAVSDREMALLQASAGELRPDMNEKDLDYNLQRIQNKYTDILKKLGYIEDNKVSPKKDSMAASETKVVNGVSYRKVPGGWEEVE